MVKRMQAMVVQSSNRIINKIIFKLNSWMGKRLIMAGMMTRMLSLNVQK